MNHADVIKSVSEKTGVAAAHCEKIVKSLEEHLGGALIEKLKGSKTARGDLLTGISKSTDIAKADCDKVVTAIQQTVKSGISEKLASFKKPFAS